jgi:hypothetical protein
MRLSVQDLEDQTRYRQILSISYSELITFVMDYIRKKSALMVFFWTACFAFFILSVNVRINISGYFPYKNILFHSVLGVIVFPLLCVPVHEVLHILPYYFTGAKDIRVGMDLRQYLFYVTAHRHVATPLEFRIVAFTPFLVISALLIILVFLLPGLWKWSLSLFLFAHSTMCAGDFALLNFYFLNRNKKIFSWDDAEKKEAYFYEKL